MNEAAEASWDSLKSALAVGTKVHGKVLRHAPFGVFVAIPGVPFDGLIQITDFKDNGRMSPAEFPVIGSTLEAIVLGYKETGRQIWLGVKPSQLGRAHAVESVSSTIPAPHV